MNKSEKLFGILKKNRLIALLSPNTEEECLTAYETLNPMGITLEVTFRSGLAIGGIKKIQKKYPDALLLAGTVMTKEQAKQAIDAGAAGIVSPDYFPDIVDTCSKNDIMCIPGGLSDCGKQLVQKAKCYGCSIEELRINYPYQWTFKLFPAFTDNNSYIGLAKAWKDPFKDIKIIYTGGISVNNLKEVVKADPDGIYCGSGLTKNIDNPEKMKNDAESWISIVKEK